jgi:tail collar domain
MVTTLLVGALVAITGGVAPSRALDESAAPAPVVGEIRTLAVAEPNADVIARLHRQGWLEADGQLLCAADFPELYGAIARTWTVSTVQEGRFAVPDAEAEFQSHPSRDNLFGVLSAADLVTGGRDERSWSKSSHFSYWIYAGRDVSQSLAKPITR